MNRKAISILAILAMLCTMFTFAMPAIAETTELALDFPKYADHANYPDTQKEWLIQDAADWKAMMATADAAAAGEEYFKGHTFHLTDDVDFSQTEWLPPMGEGKYFSGTINGHGNGFNDLKIYEGDGVFDAIYNHKDAEGTGMFQRLGNCTFIDFGVNSGCVHRATGGVRTSVTTFGSLKNGYKPTFTRVWSGMELRHANTGSVSALAVPADAAYDEAITVNGYVFDGKISTNRRNAFSLIGCIEGEERVITGDLKLTNIITDAQMYTNTRSPQHPQLNGENSLAAGAVSAPTEAIATAYYSSLFSSNSNTQMNEAIVENIYTVSYPNVVSYFGRGGDTRTIDKRMVTESALEAAWTANKNPSQSAAEPVFFTLKNGKIRPTAESKNMIVKVTLTGIKDEVYYLNANTAYDLAETFGKNDQQTFKINAETVTALALGGEDVTIEVTTECTHDGCTVTKGENANEHIRRCAICGYDKVETCSAANPTPNAITEEQLAAGEMATHNGTCDFCGKAFTVACDVDYVLSAEANKEAYWDYSACPCGRENVEHKDTAKIMCGDVTGDSAVDLLDAVRMLKKIVQIGDIAKQRNADVDGDNILASQDVVLAIRIWLGNGEAKKVANQTEARVNAENLFNSNAVTKHNLKMDGTEGNVAGYVVSNPIVVQKGEKLAFGPVRLTAPVIGYFYDAEGNPLQLINHTNVKVEYTFEEGKALASIDAPAGAETVRFQMAAEEAEQFYLRLNTAITGMDYEERFEGKEIENPLKDRTFLTVGDSLCAASNDPRIDGLRGWAQRIRDNFGAVVTNSAKGGSTLSTAAWKSDGGSETHYIYQQLNQHSGVNNFDYIMLEGGVNDHRQHTALYVKDPVKNMAAPIGEIVEDSYDPADFDSETTMAGGLERLIYKAIKDHGDTAALGYIALYEMYTHSEFSNAIPYLDMAMRICEKWGIPYVDFYNEPIEGFDPAAGAHTSDNCHAVSEGYDLMQPRINELCLEMRPVSKEIYDIVQRTELVN